VNIIISVRAAILYFPFRVTVTNCNFCAQFNCTVLCLQLFRQSIAFPMTFLDDYKS